MKNTVAEQNEIKLLNAAIDEFASLMKEKLTEKAKLGYRGWDDIKSRDIILDRLRNNLAKNDFVDVANLSMMLHFIHEKVSSVARALDGFNGEYRR